MARFTTLCSLLLLAVPASAQLAKVERRSYARMLELRAELVERLRTATPEQRRAAAAVVEEDSSGNPFEQVAFALAAASGVEADDAFVHRVGVMAMVLPEVVDMDRYRQIHVTMNAPRLVPAVDSCSFAVEVFDAKGESVRAVRIEEQTGVQDLLRFRATTAIDLEGLPEGRYEVAVTSIIDGEGPRLHDVGVRRSFWIRSDWLQRTVNLPAALDGTQERMQEVVKIASRLAESRRDALSRAILNGALWQVERVYTAEPRVPFSDAVADLERAERIFANLVEDRDALDGVHGVVTVGIPAGTKEDDGAREQVAAVTFQLAADPDERKRAKPLVIVVGAAPVWNEKAHRPSSPKTVVPNWTYDALKREGFDKNGDFHLVAVESPGRFHSAPRSLIKITEALQKVLPVRDGLVFYVGEREGAYTASRAASIEPGPVDGLVVACAGAFSKQDFERAADIDVMGIRAQGFAANQMMTVMRSRVEEGSDRVVLTEAAGVPWVVALGVNLAAVEEFIRARIR